ncbi:MAG: ROK family protein [Gorillibacterium sp.]|nr:ROK family protein [Gorillibacterium sp.]
MKLPFLKNSVALGVDIGGTKIRFGLVASDGTMLCELTLPTLAAKRRVMDQVFLGIETIRLTWEERKDSRPLLGIGIGSAGQIDFASGSVHFASDLIPGYTGTRLLQLVEQRFGLPVYVDNDVNVMALAESLLGAGKGLEHIVCIALGTGVGGAIIVGGELLHGVNGGAGEIGHMSVNMLGPRCICGNRGCLEVYASGTRIAKRYQEKIELKGLNPSGALIETRQVIAQWLNQEPEAVQVMEEAITALGAAIASLIHVFNPQAVIIGGGLAEIGESLFTPLRTRIGGLTMPSMLQSVRLVPAELGENSNMVGAALQVWVYR